MSVFNSYNVKSADLFVTIGSALIILRPRRFIFNFERQLLTVTVDPHDRGLCSVT
jgi:hypothetical protein